MTPRKFYNQNKFMVDSIHRKRYLSFTAIGSVAEARSLQKARIYKSPVRGRGQSSEYYVAELDGDMVYLRISNHWGTFFRNITDTAEAIREHGMKDAEAEAAQAVDPFGRIGAKKFVWSLENGNLKSKRSQAGYIRLDEVS